MQAIACTSTNRGTVAAKPGLGQALLGGRLFLKQNIQAPGDQELSHLETEAGVRPRSRMIPGSVTGPHPSWRALGLPQPVPRAKGAPEIEEDLLRGQGSGHRRAGPVLPGAFNLCAAGRARGHPAWDPLKVLDGTPVCDPEGNSVNWREPGSPAILNAL